MLRPSSGLFSNRSASLFKFIFRLFRRHWQQEAESAEAKLRALNSRVNELRERFKQAQSDVEVQQVRTDRMNLTRT
jgi:multidrug resistance efflux pump